MNLFVVNASQWLVIVTEIGIPTHKNVNQLLLVSPMMNKTTERSLVGMSNQPTFVHNLYLYFLMDLSSVRLLKTCRRAACILHDLGLRELMKGFLSELCTLRDCHVDERLVHSVVRFAPPFGCFDISRRVLARNVRPILPQFLFLRHKSSDERLVVGYVSLQLRQNMILLQDGGVDGLVRHIVCRCGKLPGYLSGQ